LAGKRSEKEVQSPSDDDVVEKVHVESDEDDSESNAYSTCVQFRADIILDVNCQ
jgi:hypothetical protein